MREFDSVELGIMWDRLISIVDEIVSALVRSAFSTNTKYAGDLSCVLFDANGNSLSQGTFSQPSFTGTAPPTLRHMLKRFPPATLEPGDVLITNDPWMGTGHLYDVNVMRPVFRGTSLVGYTISVTHLPDIGGLGFGTGASDIYQEGIQIPINKLYKAGRLNEELLEMILANVRLRDMVSGDIMANVTCNEVGGRALLEFMDEYGLDDLAPLSGAIIRQTERAMRAAIREIPDGVYQNEIEAEAIDGNVTLAVVITVEDGNITLDYAGTGPAVSRGINVPLCYTRAYTNYAVKTLTIPEVPNNEGAGNPITLRAPENSILNAQPPFPTGGRHVIGHFVAPLVFGALANVIPERVPAESGMMTQVNYFGTRPDGETVSSILFSAGGYGALHGMDGWATVSAPGNMINVPVEVWESEIGVTYLHKRLYPNSGGAGKYRGGAGQDMLIRNDTGNPLTLSCFAGRTEVAPQGHLGGRPGGRRELQVNDEVVHPKGRYVLAQGDTMRTLEAGGGGVGDPADGAIEALRRDIAEGFLTVEGARLQHGLNSDET